MEILIYQRMMEQFYDDIAQALKGTFVYDENSPAEEPLKDQDLLVFEQGFNFDYYDNRGDELLKPLLRKGYEIMMNFQARDVMNGNVVVKLRDKWFAFGHCRNDAPDDKWITRVWPLKYVLTRMRQMEASASLMIPIDS